jgi:predicted aspartyl protease
MCNKTRIGLVLIIASVGGGTWLLAQPSQKTSPKPAGQPVAYSITNLNKEALMLDSLCGKTWMLRRLEDGKPTWLPIPRIDSEADAAHLWRKSSAYSVKTGSMAGHIPLDISLKDQGFRGIPIDRLRSGYLAIEVRVEGKKVYLLLDTGAPVTHLDLERTKHLQLKWQSFDEGINKKRAGATARSFCEISKLEIGGIEVRHLVIGGHDESEMNKALKSYMDPLLDGELGSDVLTKLNAIIDYSTLTLHIRSPASR